MKGNNAIELVASKAAIDGVDALYSKLKLTHEEILKISKLQIDLNGGSSPKTLSDLNLQLTASQKLTKQNQEQAKSIQTLHLEHKKRTQATAEELVNNGILNRQAREAATINSTLAGAYQKLSAAQAKSARAVQDIIARGRTAGQTQKSYNRELQVAQREFDRLNQKVLLADRAVGKFNRNVGNYPKLASGFKDLLGAFGLIGGVTAIAAITRGIFQTTRELQAMDLALTQVIGTTEQAAVAQEFLGRISEAYGVKIQVLTKSYTGFWAAARNAMDAGSISGSEVNQIFESVAKAAGAMGLSVEQQEGAFLALQQMISKGTVQAEELRGQLSERLPGAFGILAKSMGVTEKELNKLLKDGKVLAAEVLPAFAKELERAYGVESLQRVNSLNASITRLGNTWTNFVRSLNEGDGTFSKILTASIDAIGNVLKGYEFLFTSAEKNREGQLKSIRAEAYKSRMEMLKDANKDELQQYKDDNQELANEVQVRLAKLRVSNTDLSKNTRKTPFGNILSKADENQIKANNKEIQLLNNTLSGYYGRIEAINDLLKDDTKAKVPDVGKEIKQRYLELADFEASRYALMQARRGNEADLNEKIFNDEEVNYERREQAARKYLELQREMTEARKDEGLRVLQNSLDNEIAAIREQIKKKEVTERNGNNVIWSLQKKFNIDSLIVWEQYASEINTIAEKAKEALKGVYDQINFQKAFNLIDQRELDNLETYNQLLQNTTSGTDYRKAEQAAKDFFLASREVTKARLQAEYDQIKAKRDGLTDTEANVQKRLELDNQLIDKQSELTKVTKEELDEQAAAWKKLQEATEDYIASFTTGFFDNAGLGSMEQFFDGTFKRLIDGADSTKEKFAVTFNAIAEVAKEAMAFIDQVQQQNFEAQYSRLEQQRDLAISFAGDSVGAREEIERQYDEKRRELARRQAEQQKQNALFSIALSTAQGIVGALAMVPPNVPLSIAIGVIGATQAAMVAKRQIPQYEKGTMNAPGGLAIVDEARPEVHTDKHGNIKSFGSEKGANYRMTAPGDRIYTSRSEYLNKTLKKMGISPVGRSFEDIAPQFSGASAAEIDGIMGKYFANIQVNKTTLDKNGFSHYSQRAGQKTIHANNRSSGTGYTV